MGRARPAPLLATIASLALSACASTSSQGSEGQGDGDAEAPRVPDPPPRYKRVDVDASPLGDAGGGDGTLQIKCGGQKPYVCTMDDGSFVCSAIPCLPDCSRVGCVGGDVCAPCEGGYRCVAPGSSC